MFWLCVMTAEAFTAWAAGLTNCKGSNAQVKIKPSSLEARRDIPAAGIWRVPALPKLKATDGGKKGWWIFTAVFVRVFG